MVICALRRLRGVGWPRCLHPSAHSHAQKKPKETTNHGVWPDRKDSGVNVNASSPATAPAFAKSASLLLAYFFGRAIGRIWQTNALQ
jgi:hypothetical protein